MVMEVQGTKSEALRFSVSNNGELFYRSKSNIRVWQVLVVSALEFHNIYYMYFFSKSTDIGRRFSSVHSEQRKLPH